MVWNYIRLGVRRIMGQKAISLINIFGLSVGFGASAAIFSYIAFELSFDNFHSRGDSIYRIHLEGGDPQKTFPALGPAMSDHFPEVVESVRLKEAVVVFGSDLSKFVEDKVYFTDSSFFNVFSYPLLYGEAGKVLKLPNSIVISEAASIKYFGNVNSVGKTLYNLSQEPNHPVYQITGVFKNVPENSHLKFDFLISYSSLPESYDGYQYRWSWRGIYTYLLLANSSDSKKIERDYPDFISEFKSVKYNSIQEKSNMTLVRIDKIHNWEGIKSFTEKYGDINILKFLIVLGMIILLISIVNYINLATARASDRAKEIGLRKVVGAVRPQIVAQYFVESITLIVVSFGLSILVYFVLINYLDSVLGTPLSRVGVISKPSVFFIMVTTYLLLILASLFYPAFVLSSYSPAKNFAKNAYTKSRGWHLSVRQILVIFQFSSTIALLAITLTIYNQIEYMRSQRLGIKIDKTLVVKPPSLSSVNKNNQQVSIGNFFYKVKPLNEIESITASDMIPGRQFSTYWYNMDSDNSSATRLSQNIEFAISRISDNFFKAFGISLVSGMDFSGNADTVKRQAVINEFAARILGYMDPSDAIGRRIKLENDYEIVGVVADYHHFSLKDAVVPTVFLNEVIEQPYYSIKFSNSTNNPDLIIPEIQKYWMTVYPDDIFDYYFLDVAYNSPSFRKRKIIS